METDRDKEKLRTCLSCGKEFWSTWCGNRICPKCKASPRFHEKGLPVVTTQDLKHRNSF